MASLQSVLRWACISLWDINIFVYGSFMEEKAKVTILAEMNGFDLIVSLKCAFLVNPFLYGHNSTKCYSSLLLYNLQNPIAVGLGRIYLSTLEPLDFSFWRGQKHH